jgi:hypothetical protein
MYIGMDKGNNNMGGCLFPDHRENKLPRANDKKNFLDLTGALPLWQFFYRLSRKAEGNGPAKP